MSEGIHGNTGAMGQAAVYMRAKFGTKDLITNCIGELASAMEQVGAVAEPTIALSEKLEMFRRASVCFERSALCSVAPAPSVRFTWVWQQHC